MFTQQSDPDRFIQITSSYFDYEESKLSAQLAIKYCVDRNFFQDGAY